MLERWRAILEKVEFCADGRAEEDRSRPCQKKGVRKENMKNIVKNLERMVAFYMGNNWLAFQQDGASLQSTVHSAGGTTGDDMIARGGIETRIQRRLHRPEMIWKTQEKFKTQQVTKNM
jgi:hypothetical protein